MNWTALFVVRDPTHVDRIPLVLSRTVNSSARYEGAFKVDQRAYVRPLPLTAYCLLSIVYVNDQLLFSFAVSYQIDDGGSVVECYHKQDLRAQGTVGI